MLAATCLFQGSLCGFTPAGIGTAHNERGADWAVVYPKRQLAESWQWNPWTITVPAIKKVNQGKRLMMDLPPGPAKQDKSPSRWSSFRG